MAAPDADHQRETDGTNRSGEDGMLKWTLRSNRAVANVDLLRYPAEYRKQVSLADVFEDHLQRDRHEKKRDDSGQASDLVQVATPDPDEKIHQRDIEDESRREDRARSWRPFMKQTGKDTQPAHAIMSLSMVLMPPARRSPLSTTRSTPTASTMR